MFEYYEKEQDEAGKWRVRVYEGLNMILFLKFQEEPTNDEIESKILEILNSRIQEEATPISNDDIIPHEE